MMKNIEEIQGFKVFPLQFDSSSTGCHYLYVKEHNVRAKEEHKPPGLTLFVLNIPCYATSESLKHAFSTAGGIKDVILEASPDKNDGFQRGYIVFTTRDHLLKALKLNKLNCLSTKEAPIKTGMAKWLEEYKSSTFNPELLKKEIENFMQQYDEREKLEKSKEEVVDDEGWTVVTKGGRRPGLKRKQSVQTKINEKSAKKSKKNELKNFYTFQKREFQMKNIATLRKNYEEAKKKVEMMKKARRFKPY